MDIEAGLSFIKRKIILMLQTEMKRGASCRPLGTRPSCRLVGQASEHGSTMHQGPGSVHTQVDSVSGPSCWATSPDGTVGQAWIATAHNMELTQKIERQSK